MLDSFRALYQNSECVFRMDYGNIDWFKVTSGVIQGCVIHPLLFIVDMERIMNVANPDDSEINELLFADDQSLLQRTAERLQEHVEKLDESCRNYSMRISIEKTEVMCISREP